MANAQILFIANKLLERLVVVMNHLSLEKPQCFYVDELRDLSSLCRDVFSQIQLNSKVCLADENLVISTVSFFAKIYLLKAQVNV